MERDIRWLSYCQSTWRPIYLNVAYAISSTDFHRQLNVTVLVFQMRIAGIDVSVLCAPETLLDFSSIKKKC